MASAKNETALQVDVLKLPLAVIVIARDGTILDANEACAAQLGYTGGALRGRDVSELVPTPMRSKHKQHMEQFWAHPRVRRMGVGRSRVSILDAKGRERRAQIGLVPATDGKFVAALVWPREREMRWWSQAGLGLAIAILVLGVTLHYLDGLRDTGLMLVGVAAAKLSSLARPAKESDAL